MHTSIFLWHAEPPTVVSLFSTQSRCMPRCIISILNRDNAFGAVSLSALLMHCISVKKFSGFHGPMLDHDGAYIAVVPQEVVVSALWIYNFTCSVDGLDGAYPLLPDCCSARRALPPVKQ